MSIFVVGNKFDVFIKDSRDYQKHIEKCLIENMESKGIMRDKVSHVSLISAKTAYRVELLVSELLKAVRFADSLTILGHVNSGKSELFNALQRSDLCLRLALHCLLPATVSSIPGTTINEIRFPIRSSRSISAARHKRIVEQQKEEKVKQSMQRNRSRDGTNVESIRGIIRSTSSPSVLSEFPMMPECQYSYDSSSKSMTEALNCFHSQNDHRVKLVNTNWNRRVKTLDKAAILGKDRYKWCNDTSGFITNQKLCEKVNAVTTFQGVTVPCTVLLRPNWCLLIDDIISIERISEDIKSICLSMFLPSTVPVSLVRSDHMALSNFQHECIHDIQPIESNKRAIADIVINMIGWITICKPNKRMQIKARSNVGPVTCLRAPLSRYPRRTCAELIEGTPVYEPRIPVFEEPGNVPKRLKRLLEPCLLER
ncbi:hypothetical protein ACOME3_003411 [Neoechinorhynchus agilis]